MDVTPMVAEGLQVIAGYGDGGFTITGERYDHAVIVRPESCQPWSPVDPAAFTLMDFEPLWQLSPPPDVVLIGCGQRGRMLAPSLRAELRAKGLVCDGMDTGAACRTYNVLLSEGRLVAAALLPVD